MGLSPRRLRAGAVGAGAHLAVDIGRLGWLGSKGQPVGLWELMVQALVERALVSVSPRQAEGS